jgi:hypothetical protein
MSKLRGWQDKFFTSVGLLFNILFCLVFGFFLLNGVQVLLREEEQKLTCVKFQAGRAIVKFTVELYYSLG